MRHNHHHMLVFYRLAWPVRHCLTEPVPGQSLTSFVSASVIFNIFLSLSPSTFFLIISCIQFPFFRIYSQTVLLCFTLVKTSFLLTLLIRFIVFIFIHTHIWKASTITLSPFETKVFIFHVTIYALRFVFAPATFLEDTIGKSFYLPIAWQKKPTSWRFSRNIPRIFNTAVYHYCLYCNIVDFFEVLPIL